MGKWLAGGTIAVVALLIVMWYQLRAPHEARAAASRPAAAAAAVIPAAAAAPRVAEPAEAAPGQPRKIDPQSDEFFSRFDDLQPQLLDRAVADCYTGGIHRVHRNQKVKLTFRDRIKNGEVTIYDVKVDPSTTITDKALIDCFVKKASEYHWHDDELPDWDQSDMLLIRPERGMKKHTKENLDYEGDGPDFTKDHPVAAPSPAPSPTQ